MTQPHNNHLLQTVKSVFVPVHPAGVMFVVIFALGSLGITLIWHPLGWGGLVATLWCIYFFRDPSRISPIREGLIVSPADGVVQRIVKCAPPAELELGIGERTRISVFLNLFDVHVNRIPIEGSISKLAYNPGKFFNASLDKASEENERQSIKITTPDGLTVGLVQIAGLVARRILCELKEGESVKTGERFGIIRFGSRVDVYLPPDATPLVIEGQRAIGGETILADLKSTETQRVGTKH